MNLNSEVQSEGSVEESKIPFYYLDSCYRNRKFFVMSYLPESIDDFISSSGEIGKERMIIKAAVQMFDAVKWLHGLGYVHRDIKP